MIKSTNLAFGKSLKLTFNLQGVDLKILIEKVIHEQYIKLFTIYQILTLLGKNYLAES